MNSDEWREHPGPAAQLVYEIPTNTGEENLILWAFADLPAEFIPSSVP